MSILEEYPYPFERSKKCKYLRLTINILEILNVKITSSYYEDIYPEVISTKYAYCCGPSLKNWQSSVENLVSYCILEEIKYFCFIWDDEVFKFKAKDIVENPKIKRKKFIEEYNVGSCIPLLETPLNTLENFCLSNIPIQMFLSPDRGNINSSISKFIPRLTQHNPSCFTYINDNNLKCYCHASLAMNLGNTNQATYIADILSYASSHGFLGVVFHVGKQTNKSLEDTLDNMLNNIVEGISLPEVLYSKFLLETPAGQGTEVLTTLDSFLSFCLKVNKKLKKINPDLCKIFSTCIDTCHVFASGHNPHIYIEEMHKQFRVNLVHFNDSKNEWRSKVDRHAKLGKGHIPSLYLLNCAKFCKENNIDMIEEI